MGKLVPIKTNKLVTIKIKKLATIKTNKMKTVPPKMEPIPAPVERLPRYKVVATMPDGRKINVRRDNWHNCMARAEEMGAIKIVDGARHNWKLNKSGRGFYSAGISKMK